MLRRFGSVALLVMRCCLAQRIPPNAEAALDKGIADFQKEQYPEAQRDLEKAVRLSPADARAINC